MGALALGVILLAAAVLVTWRGEEPIAGLTKEEFAAVASLGALALLMASGVISAFRGRFLDGVRALATWAALGLALVAGYSYRFELQEVASRLAAELMPGEATVTPAGEVVVSRRIDGSFVVNGAVNGRPVRFIFDTGASAVVLTAETAASAGFEPSSLTYSVPVATANGRTLAALVTLDRVTIGSITEERVRALVARPGALRENLLGMTFLERLASYEVRNNRLTLRGRGA